MKINQQEFSFRFMIEAAPVSLTLVDKEEKIVYTNQYTEKLFLYNRKDVQGQNLTLLLPDLHQLKPPDFWLNLINRPVVFDSGEEAELTARTKTGKRFPVEVRMTPVQTGEDTNVLVVIVEAPEGKKPNEQFRLIVESALNAMILTDTAGKIAMVNNQTEVLFGYERDELIGKKIEILVPQRMKQQHPEHRRKFYAHPKARPMGAGRDLYGIRKDGTEIPVEIGLNPVEKDGNLFVLASIIDITERKKNEEALQVYARQVEKKNQELEEFTNVASHDLREPLNSIISLTEILMHGKNEQLDEEGQKMLSYISKSSSRMSEMITGLLEYARMGKSKELTLTDLNELMQNVLMDLDASIKASNAKVQVDRLPAMHVYAMEIRLLFQNLVSNALKYRKPTASPEITISVKSVEKGWEFSFSDNGIGIPENQKENIFQLFHRLHGRSQYEGTGIGLAHCRKIVELHNGTIWVESVLDKGSTFYFFLPVNLEGT